MLSLLTTTSRLVVNLLSCPSHLQISKPTPMNQNQAEEVQSACNNCPRAGSCNLLYLPESRRVNCCPLLALKFIDLNPYYQKPEQGDLTAGCSLCPENGTCQYSFLEGGHRFRACPLLRHKYNPLLARQSSPTVSSNPAAPDLDISYKRATEIAFSPDTDDKTANQFTTTLADVKHIAEEAGQPVTLFAKFRLTADGQLRFDIPIEYDPKARTFELQAILSDKFDVKSYRGKQYYQLNNVECREAIKQVRAGNTDLFKFKK